MPNVISHGIRNVYSAHGYENVSPRQCVYINSAFDFRVDKIGKRVINEPSKR